MQRKENTNSSAQKAPVNSNQKNTTQKTTNTINEQEYIMALHEFTLAVQGLVASVSLILSKKLEIDEFQRTISGKMREVGPLVAPLVNRLRKKDISETDKQNVEHQITTYRNNFLNDLTKITNIVNSLDNFTNPVTPKMLIDVNIKITNFIKYFPELQEADKRELATIAKESKNSNDISIDNVIARLAIAMQVKNDYVQQLFAALQKGYGLVRDNIGIYNTLITKNRPLANGIRLLLTKFVGDTDVWGNIAALGANPAAQSEEKLSVRSANYVEIEASAPEEQHPAFNPQHNSQPNINSQTYRSAKVSPANSQNTVFGNPSAPPLSSSTSKTSTQPTSKTQPKK